MRDSLKPNPRSAWVSRAPLSLSLGCVLVLAAGACLPPDVDVADKRCDEDRQCPGGYFCSAEGRCKSIHDVGSSGDAGTPVNLLVNPGFEEGTQGWVSSPALVLTSSDTAKQGTKSVRLAGTGLGATVRLSPAASITPAVPSKYYCASVWVQGTEGVQVTLSLAEQGGSPVTETLALKPSWQRLLTSELIVDDPVELELSMPDVAGNVVYVDEAKLWVDPSSLCQSPPP